MNAFFKELVEYNHHVNQQLILVFINHSDKTSAKSLTLFSHVLNAHHIWINRLMQLPCKFGVWDPHTTDVLTHLNQTNYEQTLLLLEHANLNQVIDYANTSGKSFSNSMGDILFQIINHSTYHRGQIASDWKQHGLEPLLTDYIFYKR